jgi:hypothetical protein
MDELSSDALPSSEDLSLDDFLESIFNLLPLRAEEAGFASLPASNFVEAYGLDR